MEGNHGGNCKERAGGGAVGNRGYPVGSWKMRGIDWEERREGHARNHGGKGKLGTGVRGANKRLVLSRQKREQ